jgi:uncharacterized protein YerC
MTINNKPDSNDTQERNSPTGDTLDRAECNRDQCYDGTTPLECPELEAVAEFLATPKPIREFKTFNDLAKHFGVSRMTIYRWTRNEDVLQRAQFLVTQNQVKGDLVARLLWERIVMGQVRAAVTGDTRAAEFCEKRAWPKSPFI